MYDPVRFSVGGENPYPPEDPPWGNSKYWPPAEPRQPSPVELDAGGESRVDLPETLPITGAELALQEAPQITAEDWKYVEQDNLWQGDTPEGPEEAT